MFDFLEIIRNPPVAPRCPQTHIWNHSASHAVDI